MTEESQKKRRIGIESHKLQNPLLFGAIAAIVLLGSGGSMMVAQAVTEVTQDPGIQCGNKHWGYFEKNNDVGARTGYFPMHPDCISVVGSSYKGKYDVAVVNVGFTSYKSAGYTGWSGIIEGCSPWTSRCDSTGSETRIKSLNHNTAFNIPNSLATQNLNLKAEWVWSRDKSPENAQSSLDHKYLTNLWFKHKTTGKLLVIDFMWDKLINYQGTWEQQAVSDTAPAPGTQYYYPNCANEGGVDTFHYNVVLDNTYLAPDTWRTKTVNINSYLNDAFSSLNYAPGGSCSSTNPGARSNWDLLDIESGIELVAGNSISKGEARGAFGHTQLYY